MKMHWKIVAGLWLLCSFSLMAQVKDLAGPRGVNWATSYGNCCSATMINDVIKIDDVIVVAFSIDPLNPNPPFRVGLQISRDSGLSWQNVRSLGATDPTITVSFQQLVLAGRRIYAQATSHKIYYSDDHGQTWLPVDPESKLIEQTANPVAGIYADANYLYAHSYKKILTCTSACRLERHDRIYRIPHSLKESSIFNIMENSWQLQLTPTGTGSWFVTDTEGKVYELNANFQRLRTVFSPGSTVYDIEVKGDYVALMSNVLYESYDGGYSFIKANWDGCETNHLRPGAAIVGDELFISTFCGVVRKKLIPGASFFKLEPIDFYSRIGSGMFYDAPRQKLYFTSVRLHSYDFASQQGETYSPLPGNAQLNDVFEFDGNIYAGTADSGIWRYENNRWREFSKGLSIQNYDRIPGAHYGNAVYQFGTLDFPSYGRALCAGTSYGLYCLNTQTDSWHDMSSNIFLNLPGEVLSGGTAILAFKQLSNGNVLLAFNHLGAGMNQNGTEIISPVAAMEEELKKTIPDLKSVVAHYNKSFGLRSPIQKTSFEFINGKIIKAEGSFKALGGFSHWTQSYTRSGLNQFTIPADAAVGYFYTTPSQTLIGTEFLTSDVQAIVKYGKGYAAAVRGAGVYFSDSVENGWLLRNKLLGNQYLNSLAMFNSVLYVGTDLGIYQWDPDKSQWGLVEGTVTDNITVLRPYSGGLLVGTTQGVKALQLKAAGRKRNKILRYVLFGSAL